MAGDGRGVEAGVMISCLGQDGFSVEQTARHLIQMAIKRRHV